MAIELNQFDIEYRPRTVIKEISINQEAGILYKVNCSKKKAPKTERASQASSSLKLQKNKNKNKNKIKNKKKKKLWQVQA